MSNEGQVIKSLERRVARLEVNDNARAGFRVRKSTVTATTSGAVTTLLWDTVVNNTGSVFSTGMGSGLITPPVSGWYTVHANVEWAASTAGDRILQVASATTGGATIHVAGRSEWASPKNSAVVQSCPGVIHISTTQRFIVQAVQDSGGTLNISASTGLTVIYRQMATFVYMGA